MTTFLYDDFGAVTNETVLGVAGTNTIERFYDSYGRDAGYALNGIRQSTLSYDPATGRLVTMLTAGSDTPFTWSYLSGSDLKSSLAYPNGLTASWTYGNRGELLEVNNALADGSISKYDYTYDAVGRRIACAKSGTAFEQPDSVNYGYNARSELTSATAAVDSDYRYGYNFDDIGNRKTSSERGTNSVYTASQLNQYTAVNDFTPTYDADGNETIVKTATGIWNVFYNGENRPVRWAQGDTVITMSFDRMGRRVIKNDQRFVYDGYLQIANVHSTTATSNYNYYIWDPTESVATRPLVWRRQVSGFLHLAPLFYTHDGNKNVSEVISFDGTLAAHYEYAPFGVLTVSRGVSAASNHWRFSSEYVEDDTTTIYYNYRHYEPMVGRWMSLDLVESKEAVLFVGNSPVTKLDRIGLYGNPVSGGGKSYPNEPDNWGFDGSAYDECPDGAKIRSLGDGSLAFFRTDVDDFKEKECNGCGAKGGQKFPDSYMGIVDFTGCCNDHDVCYGTCGRDKSICDKNLGDCMRGKCEQALKYVYHEKALCNKMAAAYEIAVSSFGDSAFEAGQDSGCIWRPCCKKK